jgi:tetratricopeptide (TPR) repeat protein
MADLFEKKDRHVIPNWRSFENTAKLGELNGSIGIHLDSTFRPDISDLIEDWGDSKSIGVAGDILGAALVCNQERNPIVLEVSNYILQNKDIATSAIIEAAENVLKRKNTIIDLNYDINSTDIFDDKTSLIEIHIKINSLKRKLIDNPCNPINWVDIARLYSILGQGRMAERAVKNALYLSPENRFVLRSVARFLVHIGDFDFAHEIIIKSQLARHDTWLLATEISLAALKGRNSRFAKTGLQIVDSGKFHPFNITELASALATLEMENGSLKQSKRLFRKSLIKPNDNSLAQAEWASQEDNKLNLVNPSQFQLINSFEAMAMDFSEQKKWKESIECSKKWFFDLPFSRTSVLFGNEIASRKMKDHNEAVAVAKLGLVSHPNDAHLLNNIIYSLCLQNKTDEAKIYLDMVKKEDHNVTNDTAICLTATRGLYYFRIGFHDIGRQLYLESMKMSNASGNIYLNSLALINFIREEILIGEEDVSEIIQNLHIIAKHYDGKDIAEDANEVISLYNNKKLLQ